MSDVQNRRFWTALARGQGLARSGGGERSWMRLSSARISPARGTTGLGIIRLDVTRRDWRW
jgi:hypothetical protein